MNDLNYANFGWRCLSASIDGLILLIGGCLLGGCLGILIYIALLTSGLDKNTILTIIRASSVAFGVVMRWLYCALLESSSMQGTIGKKLCGMIVTDVEGNRISFFRATGRFFGRYLSALICLAGYIMAAFTVRHQTLHDKLASTVVLKPLASSTIQKTLPETLPL